MTFENQNRCSKSEKKPKHFEKNWAENLNLAVGNIRKVFIFATAKFTWWM